MKSKTSSDRTLQSHLESFKRLILSEECTRKRCFVKLNQISSKLLARHLEKQSINCSICRYKSRKSTQTHKHLKTKEHKSRIYKHHRKEKSDSLISSRSQTAIRTSSFSKKSHEVRKHLIGSVDAISNCKSLNRQQCDLFTSLENPQFTGKKSVVIPFSKQHRKQSDSNLFRELEITSKTTSEKSKIESNKDFPISSLPAFTEKLNNLESQTVKSSTLNTTQNYTCLPHNMTINDRYIASISSSISWCESAQEKTDIITSKNKLVLRKCKETWHVKMRSCYYSTETTFTRSSNVDLDKKLRISSNNKSSSEPTNNCESNISSLQTITEQEINDGLPDI